MTLFAHHLIAASLQSALVIALLSMLLRCLPRSSAQIRATLWLWALGLGLLALCLSPIRLHVLPVAATTAPTLAPTLPSFHADATTSADVPADHAAWGAPWAATLLVVWLAGVLAGTLIACRRYVGLRQLLGRAQKTDDYAVTCKMLCNRHGIARAPRIVVSVEARTPFVTGLLSPTIVLPAAPTLPDGDIKLLLGHELAHVARRDLPLGLIADLADIVFWFHSGVRYAVRAYRDTREMACDARVLTRQNVPPRRYGLLLLQLGIETSAPFGIAAASRQFRVLKARLDGLKQHDRGAGSRLALVMVLPMLVVGVPWRLMAAPTDRLVGDASASSSSIAYAVITQGSHGHDSDVTSRTHEQSNRIAELNRTYPTMFWLDTGRRQYLFTDADTIARAEAIIAPQRRR